MNPKYIIFDENEKAIQNESIKIYEKIFTINLNDNILDKNDNILDKNESIITPKYQDPKKINKEEKYIVYKSYKLFTKIITIDRVDKQIEDIKNVQELWVKF